MIGNRGGSLPCGASVHRYQECRRETRENPESPDLLYICTSEQESDAKFDPGPVHVARRHLLIILSRMGRCGAPESNT
jgi:hypothetical protein